VAQHRDRREFGWDATGFLRAAQDLLPRTEQELWALWTGRQAQAAQAWNEAGKVGPEVDAWVKLGLGPVHVAALLAPLSEDGAGLTVGLRSVAGRGPRASHRLASRRFHSMPSA
jgi:hypothetical protein